MKTEPSAVTLANSRKVPRQSRWVASVLCGHARRLPCTNACTRVHARASVRVRLHVDSKGVVWRRASARVLVSLIMGDSWIGLCLVSAVHA
eukprot:1697582-Pleurochrysis_carterae.AAC.1